MGVPSAETDEHNPFAQCLLNTSGPCTAASLLCLPLPAHVTPVPDTLTCSLS